MRGSFFRPNLRLSTYRKGGGDDGATGGRPRARRRREGRRAPRSCSLVQRAPRPERHHLRLSRKACEALADVLRGARRARRRLPRRHGAGARATRSRTRSRATRSTWCRDDRVRHGHRQVERPLRDPPRHAALDRELLPGDRARRPRRAAQRLRAVLLVGRRAGVRSLHRRARRRRRGGAPARPGPRACTASPRRASAATA